MADDNLFSLFKESSRHLDHPARPAEKTDQPTPSQKATPSDTDIEDMLSKMSEMHDNLNEKLRETCERFGMDKNEIRNFLENTNNFRVEEWKNVQSQRKQLLSEVWKTLGKKEDEGLSKEELEKKEKLRKGKTLGSRRNWISMH